MYVAKAAASDAQSRKSATQEAMLATVLLYLRAQQQIEAACMSSQVSDNVQTVLSTKQASVAKRMRHVHRGR
jgi:hypothetical protein